MATETAKTEKKTPARQVKPRAAYILLNLPEGVSKDDLEVIEVTRKADEALEAVENKKAGVVLRVMVK